MVTIALPRRSRRCRPRRTVPRLRVHYELHWLDEYCFSDLEGLPQSIFCPSSGGRPGGSLGSAFRALCLCSYRHITCAQLQAARGAAVEGARRWHLCCGHLLPGCGSMISDLCLHMLNVCTTGGTGLQALLAAADSALSDHVARQAACLAGLRERVLVAAQRPDAAAGVRAFISSLELLQMACMSSDAGPFADGACSGWTLKG